MNSRIRTLFFGTLVFTAATAFSAQSPAVSWEDLPLLRPGVKTYSHASVDPAGVNNDMSNSSLIENGEFTLKQNRGRGMLVHFWATNFETGHLGNLRICLDKTTPTWDFPRDIWFDQWPVDRREYPHLKPLWGKAFGPYWAFPLFAYDSLFRLTCTAQPNWYQATTHQYREERFDEGLDSSQIEQFNDLLDARWLNGNQGVCYGYPFPGRDSGDQIASGTFASAAAQPVSLFGAASAGVVRIIRMKPAAYDTKLDNVWITMTTDAANDTTVNLPLSMFFGCYPGKELQASRGLPAGYNSVDDYLYFYFPMPYRNSMTIALTNKSGAAVSIAYDIRTSSTNPYPAGSAGTFRIKYNKGLNRPAGKNHTVHLDVQGSGLMVGQVGTIAQGIEGNFSAYIDGMRTPSLESTGGEDYFCHAFGIKPDLRTQFMGGYTTEHAYRWHIVDYIPFNRSLIFIQEQDKDDAALVSAIFYYIKSSKLIAVSDSIDVGNSASEQAHSYTISGSQARVQSDVALYEGALNAGLSITDEGRWTNGETGFTLAIDPANDGVRLRKRVNNLVYHTSVDVYVDNQYAGEWFEQGSNYNAGSFYTTFNWATITRKFRDSEFEIPSALTAGKSSISLRFVAKASKAVNGADAGLVNEYKYWAYSYAPVDLGSTQRIKPLASGIRNNMQAGLVIAGNRISGSIPDAKRCTIRLIGLNGKVHLQHSTTGSSATFEIPHAIASGRYVVEIRDQAGKVRASKTLCY